MKASELIVILETALTEVGDLPVYYWGMNDDDELTPFEPEPCLEFAEVKGETCLILNGE